MNRVAEAIKVFNDEIDALSRTRDSLDDTFDSIIDLITNCSGKVIVTGMGKSGHIGKKMAATFASLGTPAFFLHPGEAMHGDLGMVSENDIVIAISYSGESDEIISILSNIKLIGAKIVAITRRIDSTLARNSDISQILPDFKEACVLGLAPTSSTTVVSCYGDALAIVASKMYGFSKNDFGKFHPAGALGKKIMLRVDDVMVGGDDNAVVLGGSSLKDAIIELSQKGLGMVSIVDEKNKLIGIITDGDIRRQLERGVDIYQLCVNDIMCSAPKTIQPDKLAVDALKKMKENNVSVLPVIEKDSIAVGAIRMHSIISAGVL